MQYNWYIIFISALIPLLIGFIWYHPKVMGSAWMKTNGFTDESLQGGNMPLIMGLTYLFGLLLSVVMMTVVIHQLHMGSIFADDPTMSDPNSESSLYVKHFMDTYGHKFRTFKHGSFHGILSAFFFALPVIGMNALFERRGIRYILIHLGYWIITLALMGGVICQMI